MSEATLRKETEPATLVAESTIDTLIFEQVQDAVRAAEDKKATDIVVLKLAALTEFTDYFVICTGSNPRQVQAIADEVALRLKKTYKLRPLHTEGYNAGEWILMDFGAEYGGYCADLTRTVPVNGKFTRRQKTVYNACLHLHNYAKSLLKPGITIADYTDKVGEEATQQFLKIGLLKKTDVKNEDPENRAYRKYLYHGISHHLGIDVHDLGTRTEPIKAGMVFTVEPGIYIEEEKMGVRIENNLWITRNGNKDLMSNIPITAEDIESLMKK